MISILEKSFLVQHWEYSLPVVLLVLTFFCLRRSYDGRRPQQDSGADYNEKEETDEYVPALEELEHIPFAGASVTLPGGAEAFYKIANDRRSVRMYSKKHVPFEIIEACIKAAGTAPSGAHTEPWTFCVISDLSVKTQVREIIEAEEYLNYKQRMHRQWTADLKPFHTNHVKEYLTDAPHLILIFKQTYGLKADGSRKQHYYNEISVSIAAGILLCALQAAGLSSLITTPLNCGPAIRCLLKRPQNEKLLVLLPVGYPSEDCKVPDLKRKSIDEILVRY